MPATWNRRRRHRQAQNVLRSRDFLAEPRFQVNPDSTPVPRDSRERGRSQEDQGMFAFHLPFTQYGPG